MTTTSTITRPRPAEIIRAIGHLSWTLAVIIGVPWALAAFFGWPLPRQWPDWNEVTSTPMQLVDPHVVLNFFVCIAWIAWAVIVAYVVLDAVDAARGMGRRLHRVSPFGVVAGKLIASVTILVSIARPPATASAAPRTEPVVQIVELPTVEPRRLPAPPIAPQADDGHAPLPGHGQLAPTPVYRVQRGDCLWDIAEQHLGSGMRWREIHELNPFIHDPDYIEVGWLLALPDDAQGLDPPAPPVEPPLVEPQPSASEATPSPGPAEQPANTEAPTATETTAPPTIPTTPVATPAPSVVTTNPPAPDSLGASPAHGDEDGVRPNRAPIIPGITGATVLATGLLLALRRAHRRRAAAGQARNGAPLPLERAIVAAADVPMVRWAGQELATLAAHLDPNNFDATPIAVEFSEPTGIEILWDRQVTTHPPAPWDPIPGGWAWHALYDPDELVPDPDKPAPIAGLVTVGAREGRQLMINLEALGSLSITGDPLHVENFVRSLILELGSGDDLADGYVFAIDRTVDVDGAEHLDRIWTVDPDDAAGRLRASVTELDRALQQSGRSTTFAYRISTSEPAPLEICVVVARAGSDLADLIATAHPHRGVALVILGDEPQAEAHLTIDDLGAGLLEPLGLRFDAIGVPRDVAAQIAVLLDTSSTDEPLMSELEDTLAAIDAATAGTTTTETDDEPALDNARSAATEVVVEDVIDLRGSGSETPTVDDDWSPPEVRLLVKVLGSPCVPDRPGMGRREIVLTAFMACKQRPIDHDDIQDAVWGGNPVINKTIYNVVTSARSALGQWGDKYILEKHDGPGGKLTLAPGVVTDLELFRALLQRAQMVTDDEAVRLLRDALALVEGTPFGDEGFDWAHTQQFVAEAERLIEDAAAQLVELALASKDIDTCRDACLAGLRGLPGNEVLYRARMRVEDAAGNPTAIQHAFRELSNYLDDLDAKPSPETVALYGRLTRRPSPA